MTATMSQRQAREQLSSTEIFEGGVLITKNGVAELFIQTAAERLAEQRERKAEREAQALLKLIMLAKQNVQAGNTMTPEEALTKLRAARK